MQLEKMRPGRQGAEVSGAAGILEAEVSGQL